MIYSITLQHMIYYIFTINECNFFVIERYDEKIQSEAKGLFNEHSQTLREELEIKFSHRFSYFQV